ncbi:MAG: 50S ribosomal protein L23 [Patescibacteria group bacterium]
MKLFTQKRTHHQNNMALFNRKKKDEGKEAAVESKKHPVISTPVASDTGAASVNAAVYANILLKPHVSEKAAVLAERGIYVFDVPLTANKIEVGKAVKSLYRVKVKHVRIQRGIGKQMNRGRISGRRSSWKKALVELEKGQKIHLVEGV